MSRRIIYRRQLLRAIEAFLEGTPSSLTRAHQIIQRCSSALSDEEKEYTLERVLWDIFISALGDSVYYESEDFLQDTRELLLGRSSKSMPYIGISYDFRSEFTEEETAWHTQLLSMVAFLTSIPFAHIYEVAHPLWRGRVHWDEARNNLPEALQADDIEQEYKRRKEEIEALAIKSPAPPCFEDEKLYHLVLREVSTLLTSISPGHAAVFCGYPILHGYGSLYAEPQDIAPGMTLFLLNMSENILWAKRALEAITGQGGIVLSWRLSNTATLDGDAVLISLH